MIGNKSYEEHVKYFTNMFDCLKTVDQGWNFSTILKAIECKVILDQKRENLTHNLNIKNVHDTAMVKDFKKWSDQFRLHGDSDLQNHNISQEHNISQGLREHTWIEREEPFEEREKPFEELFKEPFEEPFEDDDYEEPEDDYDDYEEPEDDDEEDKHSQYRNEVQNAFEEFCTSSGPPSSERLLRCGSPPTEIPDGY